MAGRRETRFGDLRERKQATETRLDASIRFISRPLLIESMQRLPRDDKRARRGWPTIGGTEFDRDRIDRPARGREKERERCDPVRSSWTWKKLREETLAIARNESRLETRTIATYRRRRAGKSVGKCLKESPRIARGCKATTPRGKGTELLNILGADSRVCRFLFAFFLFPTRSFYRHGNSSPQIPIRGSFPPPSLSSPIVLLSRNFAN